MAKITIDGKEIEFDGKPMILQVALDHGVEIPHYCYHPGLSVVASCRICLAEIAQPNPRNDNKLEIIPKLLPTCQTIATDGMEVLTKTPKAIANQKAVMEFLLINHPLDCPVCDQAGECHLQDYSYRYGRAQSRFEEAKVKQPKKDIGPNVYLYSDRCIMCSRCVRFTREVTGTGELGIFGRGHREQIDVFPGKPLDNEMAGNVVDICPVGALLDKDFLFEQRVWFLTSTPSIDGVTASGDNISIEHNNGQIYRVKPRTNLQVNKWWISDEIRYSWKFVHSQERLRMPTRVQYGTRAESNWDWVCRDVTDRFQSIVKQHGETPQNNKACLAVMVSPMLPCEEAYLLGAFVRGLDKNAVLAVGPVPMHGEDKTTLGGYTIRAEKCPNKRGVQRALDSLLENGEKTWNYEDFFKQLSDKTTSIQGLLLTGNYPAPWATKELLAALKGKYTAIMDTLPNDLTAKADVVMPSVTWAEKSGVFENIDGRIQRFERAIMPIEMAKSEGQIALDLMAACALRNPAIYDDQQIRAEMGGVFETEVHFPSESEHVKPDMEYVEL